MNGLPLLAVIPCTHHKPNESPSELGHRHVSSQANLPVKLDNQGWQPVVDTPSTGGGLGNFIVGPVRGPDALHLFQGWKFVVCPQNSEG